MSAKIANRLIEEARAQAKQLKLRAPDSGSMEDASRRISIARQCTYLGDYETSFSVLAPYLLDSEPEVHPNEQAISQIESSELRGNLLVEIALLMNHIRQYAPAAELIHRALALYEIEDNAPSKANAYHWLAFTRLNQHNFIESERCELKRMALIYQRANDHKQHSEAARDMNLPEIIATSRIWLGILAQRQGLLMKAKTELYTARELMQSASSGNEVADPRAWGDLYSTLGRVYSCEGRYEDAIQETKKALDYYLQAGHLTFEIQTRVNLARIYVKKMASPDSSKEDEAEAKRHLDAAGDKLDRDVPQGDLRTRCLLDLTYSWFYFAAGDWTLGEKLANEAIRHARKLGSHSLLADCYRARAESAIQLHKLAEARADLNRAMEGAIAGSQFKTVGAILLSFARSYCSKIDPDQIEVDKYLDRFVEAKTRHSFESKYLDDLFAKIKRDRLELPSQRAFYFSVDDLQSAGYDAGLSKYLVWAMRAARLTAHGDMKKMTEVLHFNTLSRTYKYVKLARAVESGKAGVAQKVNKTHTISRTAKH